MGADTMPESGATGTFSVKSGLAQMLKGGVIMDVVDAEQARIAENAGAVAVMALERVPADIRADGGVARMSTSQSLRVTVDSLSMQRGVAGCLPQYLYRGCR